MLSPDDALAMPTPIGIHVTASVLGGENSPPKQPTANDPGLNQTDVFVDTRTAPKGNGMLTKHWILIGIALLAIWYFFFRGTTASLSTAAA